MAQIKSTPTARLAAWTDDRIQSLEGDRQTLQVECIGLRSEILRLAGENARLEEALGNAESNRNLARILIGVAVLLAGSAGAIGDSATRVASVSIGVMIVGMAILAWPSARRWRRDRERV